MTKNQAANSLRRAIKRTEPLVDVTIKSLLEGKEPDEVFLDALNVEGPKGPVQWEFYHDIVALVIQVAAFTIQDLKAGKCPPDLASTDIP